MRLRRRVKVCIVAVLFSDLISEHFLYSKSFYMSRLPPAHHSETVPVLEIWSNFIRTEAPCYKTVFFFLYLILLNEIKHSNSTKLFTDLE